MTSSTVIRVYRSPFTRLLVTVVCAGALLGAPRAMHAQGSDTTRHAPRDSVANADTTQHPPVGAVAAPVRDSTPQATVVPAPATPAALPPAPRDTNTVKTAADSALQRVHALVAQGQTAAARAMVDSLLTVTPQGTMGYASVLYTRATLATSADSAEDDYRRITVEYAASPRAGDALLRLAQLELARGDRAQAAAHLDRLTREQAPNQTGVSYARTELQVGLAYFDLQDATHACAALSAARSAAPTGDVELANRIDYNIQRCPTPSELAAGQPHDTTRTASSAKGADTSTKTGSTKGGASKSSSASTKGAAPTKSTAPSSANRRVRAPGYTVQVAAYQTHDAATKLVDDLNKRGYVARIYGSAAPFRVRIGRFATEAQADSANRSLKRKGITGFVTPGEGAAGI